MCHAFMPTTTSLMAPKAPGTACFSCLCLVGGVLDPCPDLGRRLKDLVQVSPFIACPWPYQGYHAPQRSVPGM
jgi:hypothetical protein